MKQGLQENKLTVIMPFLNEGTEVENTLDSIRKTVGDRVDILIINDASTDQVDYRSIARKYEAVYIEHKKRKGVAMSRDQGIELVHTPYFLLLDAHMRFYQNDWIELIVQELDKDDRVLLCCDTKVLRRDGNGKVYEEKYIQSFGARVNVDGNGWMLNAEWVGREKEPEKRIEDIACVLGAGYAASKRYWKYLRGLEGLIYYGSDEPYISFKVWQEGGRCRLLKDIKAGHIYRPQPPYKIDSADAIFNRLWIAELFLPLPYKLRTFGGLYEVYPEKFKEAFRMLGQKKAKIKELRGYYDKIFTVHIDDVIKLNQKEKEEIGVDERKEREVAFRQVLLNCCSLTTDGLWYGRMGCLLFLAQYDHLQNNDLYEELIGELTDSIYVGIEKSGLTVDFSEGLCGLAFGVAWLLDNELMGGDVDEILEEVDLRIMERDPLRMTDFSWKTGLAGILYYVLYRLQIAQERNLSFPFDEKYLSALYQVACRVVKDPEKAECYEMASWLVAYMQNHALKLEIPDLIQVMNLSTLKESLIAPDVWGLRIGWAGLGLSRLAR